MKTMNDTLAILKKAHHDVASAIDNLESLCDIEDEPLSGLECAAWCAVRGMRVDTPVPRPKKRERHLKIVN